MCAQDIQFYGILHDATEDHISNQNNEKYIDRRSVFATIGKEIVNES